MTQTTELSKTREGYDGPHGSVFGQTDAELFAASRSQPPVYCMTPNGRVLICDGPDEDDRR